LPLISRLEDVAHRPGRLRRGVLDGPPLIALVGLTRQQDALVHVGDHRTLDNPRWAVHVNEPSGSTGPSAASTSVGAPTRLSAESVAVRAIVGRARGCRLLAFDHADV